MIRTEFSMRALARKLPFSRMPVFDWDHGRRHPDGSDVDLAIRGAITELKREELQHEADAARHEMYARVGAEVLQEQYR